MGVVIVFSSPWCPQSEALIRSLREAGITFQKLSAETSRLAETLGVDTTPAVFIHRGESYHRVDEHSVTSIRSALGK